MAAAGRRRFLNWLVGSLREGQSVLIEAVLRDPGIHEYRQGCYQHAGTERSELREEEGKVINVPYSLPGRSLADRWCLHAEVLRVRPTALTFATEIQRSYWTGLCKNNSNRFNGHTELERLMIVAVGGGAAILRIKRGNYE